MNNFHFSRYITTSDGIQIQLNKDGSSEYYLLCLFMPCTRGLAYCSLTMNITMCISLQLGIVMKVC